ncbi:rhodanese-like domain-containing protein [Bacillus sp. DTU_2020_1000418_1_SI_GHA_SEK_038]|uniref:rhodanese-like domain-containing protein n=1 Tax=Bacillus sp. DTU_2020_1000418_1_SI_GHA_SEK_038 TaxID=3077585 RepID=UPI0028ED4D63|nr:rhodanese-like domain-containing protein [Bacillus sp. DTU_2020_1000418_1_SI_GHA_SEK_038]WNS75340.1 rhodanese-like domain-containing protein [Bacillus sp. DTU_2020_1000418_1_SI_GHA_SEK_038]
MRKLFLFILLASLLTVAGCSSKASFETVSIEKAKELINEGKVTVIDVRSQDEYNEGHIPGATLIPLPELKDRTDELDKDTHYLIVCRSGNRSAQASEILVDNGFKHIYNLEKGMNEWK